jgi:hypothetical protein
MIGQISSPTCLQCRSSGCSWCMFMMCMIAPIIPHMALACHEPPSVGCDTCREGAVSNVRVPVDVINLLAELRTHLQEKCEPPVYVSDRRLVKSVALMQVGCLSCSLTLSLSLSLSLHLSLSLLLSLSLSRVCVCVCVCLFLSLLFSVCSYLCPCSVCMCACVSVRLCGFILMFLLPVCLCIYSLFSLQTSPPTVTLCMACLVVCQDVYACLLV